MGERCETCCFFKSYGGDGVCRRYLPSVSDYDGATKHANVRPSDWCGEWQLAVARAEPLRKPFIVVPEALVPQMQEMCGSSVDVLTSLPLPEIADAEPPVVVVCAGPPRCSLDGDAAIAAAEAGCVWCRRITVHPNGEQTESGPGES